MSVLTVDGEGIGTPWGLSTSVEGLASLIKGEVPQEHEARPVDGLPELALEL